MDMMTAVLILFGALFVFLMLGMPIAFAMSGVSIVMGFFIWGGIPSVEGFILGTFGKVNEFVYTAVPLYIFMAAVLRYSDLADGMYEALYRWLGAVRGGLAIGTVFISTIFAAMVGITSVATATLGASALPSMLKRNYDERLTTGIIMAGSNLGIIIPPSIIMIIYAMVAQVSPGKMFMAGILPGLLMMALLIVYVIVLCWIDPGKGPALPAEERFSWREKFVSLKSILLPMVVIAIVLGTIFAGIATPTESAAIGATGSLLAAAVNRKLTWSNLYHMLKMTVGLTSMLFWLIFGAAAYAKVVSLTGLGNAIADFVSTAHISPYFILTLLFLIFFILGMFLDPTAIIFMTGPVIIPLLLALDFDLIWFGVVFILSSCIANLTPPFGICLFVLKGVAPGLEMKQLYYAIVPFVFVYIIGIIIITVFPDIVMYLPNQME